MKRQLRVVRGDEPPPSIRGAEPLEVDPRAVRRLLGQTFGAVVLDLRGGLDANALGQAHGLVRGGGALVLRLPERVEGRFARRFERCLARSCAAPGPVACALSEVPGTPEQAAAARAVRAVLAGPPGGLVTLLADRGRGKSAALGMALSGPTVVTGPDRDAPAEVFRFARAEARYVPIKDLLHADLVDTLVVDEAAQLPVPLLQRLVRRHPRARIAFATTVHGYEGTGRGFVLRFLDWLRAEGRPLTELTLSEPIRWSPGDPLEAFVSDALLLDATPSAPSPAPPVCRELDRDALAEDDALLRSFFGLLVHAHYRTTPGDLQRLLDAPNIRLHAALARGAVVAATLLAREGELSEEACDDVYSGRVRLTGQALTENLVGHLGRRDAGRLRLLRSVRIASHPDIRRRGLARALVEHVHAAYDPDAFGTLFGTTPELLAFRRSVGYEVVRVGASRGTRTGEPAAVMLRAASPAGARLVGDLRGALARDLPPQLELLRDDVLDDDLPEPAPLTPEEVAEGVRAYAFGARTLEASIAALTRYVEGIEDLPPLLESRIRRREPWAHHTDMKRARRLFRELVERYGVVR